MTKSTKQAEQTPATKGKTVQNPPLESLHGKEFIRAKARKLPRATLPFGIQFHIGSQEPGSIAGKRQDMQ